MTTLHRRTCNLCEAMCGIVVEHDGTRVLGIRGDDEDPWSRGYLCPKATALGDLHADPDRLRTPMRRDGDSWEPCSWEDAFALASTRLAAIQRESGKDAVALYAGNPMAHNFGAMLFGVPFFEALGTKNRFSATSTDQLPHMLAALWMFGSQVLMPVPDVDRCDFLLMLGANPLVSNGSILSAPNMKGRLQALRNRGGRLVVVDPRRTETAMLADTYLSIRPETDAFLLASLLFVLFRDRRIALGRLRPFTSGLAELETLVRPFTPDRVARVTGVPADVIEELARDLSNARRAAVYGRVGICHGRFAGLASYFLYALNVVTGNLDREGGMMFTTPAFDLVGLASTLGKRGSHGTYRSRVRGLPEFGGELPVATLAEEIETEGEGRIRALVTLAGNPVLSAPNGLRIERALDSLDFMVSIDPFLNETTRHAHLILPPASQLEQSHYDVALNTFAVRNIARYSEPCFGRAEGTLADFEIVRELGTRLVAARDGHGASGWFVRGMVKVARSVLTTLGPEGVLDAGLRLGPHGPRLGGEGVTLARLRREPHGVDLGPLVSRLPQRLATPSGRIELSPSGFAADVPRLVGALDEPPPGDDGLVLVGRRQLRTNNSWLHNSPRMAKGRDRCSLLMHPEDARSRGLLDGERVRVTSKTGSVDVPLQLKDRMRPGVVSLPHGFGHDREGIRLAVASAQPGKSINDLTDDERVDPLTGVVAFSGVPVTVTPAR